MKIYKIAQQSMQLSQSEIMEYISNNRWDALSNYLYSVIKGKVSENATQEWQAKDPEFDKKKELWSSKVNSSFFDSGNQAWRQHTVNNQFAKSQSGNFKLYFTPNDEDSIKLLDALPRLAQVLQPISMQYQTNMSFKVTSTYSGFLGGNDRLVIHFANKDVRNAVNQAVMQWASNSGINMSGRTHNFGQDGSSSNKGESYGVKVANSLTENAKKHKESGQYTDEQLTQWVIKYFGHQLASLDRQMG
jgi:hypothetical protein